MSLLISCQTTQALRFSEPSQPTITNKPPAAETIKSRPRARTSWASGDGKLMSARDMLGRVRAIRKRPRAEPSGEAISGVLPMSRASDRGACRRSQTMPPPSPRIRRSPRLRFSRHPQICQRRLGTHPTRAGHEHCFRLSLIRFSVTQSETIAIRDTDTDGGPAAHQAPAKIGDRLRRGA